MVNVNELKTLLLAAVLLGLCGAAPSAHHTWLPLSEWGQSEPALPSWDYFGLSSPYPLQHRVDTGLPSWLPQPAANPPTIEIVRTFRKPAVDPAGWTQIPVIGGGRDSRHFVALVPRGFEDFVLVRKPFVIVEETERSDKDNKGEPKEKNNAKDDDSKDENKDTSKDDKKSTDRAGETTKTPEPTSSTSRPTTTVRSTSPTSMSTSTPPSTPLPDDAENVAAVGDDSQPQQSKN